MAYENFTTYTEVDPNADLTVAAQQITIDAMRNDVEAYVRSDKGVGHFTDFEHLVQVKMYTVETRSAFMFWAVTDGSSNIVDCRGNDDGMGAFVYRTGGGEYRLYLEDFEADGNLAVYVAADNTDYYTTIKRDGTAFTCKIYSDAARTLLLDTLAFTVSTDAFRYVFGVTSNNDDVYGNQEISGYVKNLDLQEEPEPEPSVATFTFAGASYTVFLTLPLPANEDNEISKEINRFNFWSGNYAIHDDGIAIQPLVLTGIEITFEALAEFEKIDEMRDNNEEITISGLGDCMDGVYIIKSFKYKTIKKAINAYLWDIILEKVRDS